MLSEDEKGALIGLCDLVETQYGLVFSESQLPVLVTKLSRTLPQIGCRSFTDALKAVEREPGLLQSRLVPTLTVGETYFFRNRAQFDALRQQVLPGLMDRLGATAPLVIWSAGCSTGEEPYSLALWIREHAPALWPDRLRIIATDINPDFLDRARAGRYRKWSFRQAESFWRKRYFQPMNGDASVDRDLGKVISFVQHNLLSGVLPSGLHPSTASVIFCRNVLIYFSHRAQLRTLELLSRAITADGFLMLGHAEHLPPLRRWRTAYYPGTFFYQPPAPEPAKPLAAGSALEGERPPASPRIEPKLRGRALEPMAPDAPRDMLEQARRAADAGDLELSRDLLERHLQHNKASIDGHFLNALVAEQLGDPHGARDALKKALFLDKDLVLGHYYLAAMDEREGALHDALRRYRTVCRLLDRSNADLELPHGDGVTGARLLELAMSRSTELKRMV